MENPWLKPMHYGVDNLINFGSFNLSRALLSNEHLDFSESGTGSSNDMCAQNYETIDRQAEPSKCYTTQGQKEVSCARLWKS